MRVKCLVKFTPNVENFKYDYEKNILVRDGAGMVLNPDDASALAYALQLKKEHGAVVEVITMAPPGVTELLRDLLRRGADRAVLITDPAYVGSDTYATTLILSRYLQGEEYDLILTGTHSLDGDTAHVPAQVAEFLGLPQLSGIRRIEPQNTGDLQNSNALVCEVESESMVYRFSATLPAVLGIAKESGLKLPFARYADLHLDVDNRIEVVTNDRLGFAADEVGLCGSLTKVVSSRLPQLEKRVRIVAGSVDEGVEAAYSLLKDKGLVTDV